MDQDNRLTKRSKEPATIRPRSSIRKGRSDVIDHVARRPRQARSKERFEKILDAAERLLQTSNIEDISFYDIAREARISPASINYLFPTTAALRIELTRRYLPVSADFALQAQDSLVEYRNPSWQSWLYETAREVQNHFNENRHVSETILAPMLHRESKRAALEINNIIAGKFVEGFDRVFILPQIPDLKEKFAYSIEIIDALFSRSYILLGTIDDKTLQDAVEMQVAYLRLILPERLPLRSEMDKSKS